MKRLALLGSTGSIGVSTLEVVREFSDRYEIVALSAGRNLDLLQQQIEEFHPRIASLQYEEDADLLRQRLGDREIEICCGVEGMIRCATVSDAEMVVTAVVGAAGMVPTMAAIEAGKDIALANKETLVTAGALVMEAAQRHKVRILPVDSEHSAIFQSLQGHRKEDIRRLILTASGGPFRETPLSEFGTIQPSDALAHPNWDMGRKISIDSATMMNKGLEVIEACWLFDVPVDRVAVHVHPQSIVHSMVEYCDGSVIAQLGIPDMKTPIACALSWPQRLPLTQPPLDLCALATLSFSEPDMERFPCLRLAFEAFAAGGTCPAVMNAANEEAVEAFLQGTLSFTGIPRLIEKVLSLHSSSTINSVEEVLHADQWSRQQAQILIAGGL